MTRLTPQTLLAAAALAGAAALPAAAQPFVAINTTPSLDTLYAFDPLDPGSASATPPIAVLAGNFIRGLDMDSPTSGWYVCTDTLSGSPIGFFRYDNGVSTMVAPLPFESVSVGGLSLSADGSFLYWISDPPDDRDDLLLRIDFDGSITELAEITLPGQASVLFNSLAVHPTTGVLYATETNTDQVVTIDPVTGVATPLGPSGIAIGAIGGADFDCRTGVYYFANGRNLYSIDTDTGAATFLGQIPTTTSSIACVPDQHEGCLADYNLDGQVNSNDISAFLGTWLDSVQNGNLIADFNLDGSVNSNDISAFLGTWLDAVQNGC